MDAGMKAARSAMLAGFDSTSNVLAGRTYGLPLSGTMAHASLLAAGAPIDAFGIGTRLDVSADAPSLDMVYKLVRLDSRDVLKLSPGKETWVGQKQVLRHLGADGRLSGDMLALAEEPVPSGAVGLLEPVMRGGQVLRADPSMAEMRAYCAAQLAALPDGLRRLEDPAPYGVVPSEALKARQASARDRLVGTGVPAAAR